MVHTLLVMTDVLFVVVLAGGATMLICLFVSWAIWTFGK